MTVAAGRPRPFLYGTKAPLSERNGSDAGNSFLSSHAAVSFAIATSAYVAMRRLHPSSRLARGVLGVGLGAAAFVATSRVMAGQHFVTDALGGALVGSSIGVLERGLVRLACLTDLEVSTFGSGARSRATVSHRPRIGCWMRVNQGGGS